MQSLLMDSVLDSAEDLDAAMYVVLFIIGLCLEGVIYTKLYVGSVRWYERRYGGMKDNRSGRASDIFGILWSGLFVLLGLVMIIPVFGLFGVVWTVCAGLLTVQYTRQLLKSRRAGLKDSAEDGTASASASDAERRLEQLETLRDAGLLTGEEYREKRREILKGS